MQKISSRITTVLSLLLSAPFTHLIGKAIVKITPNTPSAQLSSYMQPVNYAGLLDQTFGQNGIVTKPHGEGVTIAVQSNGTIIVGGNNGAGNILITAYNPDGSTATSFGRNGSTTILPGTIYDLILQADDKIVVVGSPDPLVDNHFFIARFTINGILDPSFNGIGYYNGTNYDLNSIALQSDEKIVVTGSRNQALPASPIFVTSRFNTNGTPDLSFNETGEIFGPDGGGYTIVIQSDEKIVVIGNASPNSCILRFNTNGTPDLSFNETGLVLGPTCDVIAGILQFDGKIVAIGNNGGNNYRFIRFNTDGSLDNSFGVSGVSDITAGTVFGATIQLDGKIIAVGEDETGNNFRMVRINLDGSADTSFGINGQTTTLFPPGSSAEGAACQTDNNIVVCGKDGANSVAVTRSINPYTLASFTQVYGGAGVL